MAALFLILFWLIATVGIGYSILNLIVCRSPLLFTGEKLVVSYGLGLGAVTLEMALISLAGAQFSVPGMLVWFIPLIASAFFIRSVNMPVKINKLSLLEKFFIAAISFEVLYALFRAFIMPMESYDAIAIYGLKSKIFYIEKMIPHAFPVSFKDIVPHIEYPLLVPLAETQFYIFFGAFNDILVKMIFPLYYLALLGTFYYCAHRYLNRRAALLFTFFLATIPQVTVFAANGYADIPFAFYSSASFFYLYIWIKEKSNPLLILSLLFSIFAMWTKSEGLLFALINAIILAVNMAREKRAGVPAILYVSISLFAIGSYILAQHLMGLSVNSDFSGNSPLLSKIITGLGRIGAILYEYQRQFFGPKKWNMIWILFIAGLVFGFKKIFSKDCFPATLYIFLAFTGYSVIYMVSQAPQGFNWHIGTSCSRLFLHFVPVVVLWLGLLFKEYELEI